MCLALLAFLLWGQLSKYGFKNLRNTNSDGDDDGTIFSNNNGQRTSYQSVSYNLNWSSNPFGCRSPYFYTSGSSFNNNNNNNGLLYTPRLKVRCQFAVALPITSSKKAGMSSCRQISQRVAICDESYDGNEGRAEVMCYGRDDDELVLDVQLLNSTYQCDFPLGEEEPVEYQDGSGTAVTGYFGGTAQHAVQAETLCGTPESEQGTDLRWQNIEPSLCLTNEVQWMDSSDGTTSCEVQRSCKAAYSCNLTAPFGCSGFTDCTTHIPTLNVTLDPSTSDPSCTQEITSIAEAGDACNFHVECRSKVCVHGTCQPGRLADGTEGCTHDWDCQSGTCGVILGGGGYLGGGTSTSIQRSSTRSEQQQQTICCVDGKAVISSEGIAVCGERSAGQACFDDDMCSSGVCIFGVCEADLQPDTYACQKGNHCASGACGVWTTRPKACCPSGETVEKGGIDYCTDLPIEEDCDSDENCPDGRACAIEFYTVTSKRVCCATDRSVSIIRPDSYINASSYCTDLDVFEVCGDDRMCASGGCGRLDYTSPAHVQDPQVCCPSGGSVVATRPDSVTATFPYCTGQPTGAACGSDEMCAGSAACARSSYSSFAKNVCCPGLGKISLLRPNDEYTSDNYCTGLSTASACGDDAMCASGTCLNGICVEPSDDQSGDGTDEDLCETHNDCHPDQHGGATSVCGIRFYDREAPRVCCPSNETTTLEPPNNSYASETYCAGLPSFRLCGSNDMCASNACGRLNYTSDDTEVCCPSGETVSVLRPDRSFLFTEFCTGQPAGSFCGRDEMCVATYDPITGESNPVCGRSSYSSSAHYICCPEGRAVTLLRPGNSVASDSYCTGLPIGQECGNDEMCISGACVDGYCVDGLQTNLQPLDGCANHGMCENGACGRLNYTTDHRRVCCPSGDTVKYMTTEADNPNSSIFLHGTYCTGQPTGAVCGNDDMCDDNVCARENYSLAASNVCCRPGSEKLRMFIPDGTMFATDNYCTHLPDGQPCGHNLQCLSGYCNESTGQCRSSST